MPRKARTSLEKRTAPLTVRQQAFVREYLVDLNATQAAIRAGYSPKVAGQEGFRLLKHAQIQTAIHAEQVRRQKRLEITGDRVVQELARLGMSKITDFISWGPNGLELRASDELTDDQARAVSEVTETRKTIPQRSGPPVEEVRLRFKLHDKKGALDSLGKYLGLFVDRHEVDFKNLHGLLDVVLDTLRRFVPGDKIEEAIEVFAEQVDAVLPERGALPPAASGSPQSTTTH